MAKHWFGLAAACVALAAAAEAAFAHDWIRVGRRAEREAAHRAPDVDEAMAGVTDVYEVAVIVGQRIKLIIRDRGTCRAAIPVLDETVTGGAAVLKVKNSQSDPVITQEIDIRGVEVGTTTAIITVTGEDVGTGGMDCLEQTRNKLVVRVVANQDELQKLHAAQAKSGAKTLKTAVRTESKAANGDIASEVADVLKGMTPAATGFANVHVRAHQAIVDERTVADNWLGQFRQQGIGLLEEGAVEEGEVDKRWTLGGLGSWDLGRTAVKVELEYGNAQLASGLTKAAAVSDKATGLGGDGFSFVFQLPPPAIPQHHAPNVGVLPEDPAPPLGLDLLTGYTHVNGGTTTGMWASGHFDPLRGVPDAWVMPPSGPGIPLTVVEPGEGLWHVEAVGLAPGVSFGLLVVYDDGCCELLVPFVLPVIPGLDAR